MGRFPLGDLKPGDTAPSGRPLAEKPRPGPIETDLGGRPPRQRAARKAALLVAAAQTSFEHDGVAITLSRMPRVDGRGVLECRIEAAVVDGVPVVFPAETDRLFGFVNPPVKVPDGTVRIEKDERGEDREVENFREDAQAAFQAILVQAIRGYVRRQGKR